MPHDLTPDIALLTNDARHDAPMLGDPCPYPVPRAYIRDLCAALDPHSQGQREAARLLKTSDRTVRYWCSETDPKVCPWAAAELLRRLLIERNHGDLRALPDPADYPPDPGAHSLPVMTP